MQEDIGEDDWVNSEEQTFWKGAKLAFTDMKTYILVSSVSLDIITRSHDDVLITDSCALLSSSSSSASSPAGA